MDNLESLKDDELNQVFAVKVEGLTVRYHHSEGWQQFDVDLVNYIPVKNYCKEIGRERVIALIRGQLK